ncbi:hypothetical protein P8452_56904 [Trifolium repens]|nr:hypothetical protein P8452_56904 [Trifolium repens]
MSHSSNQNSPSNSSSNQTSSPKIIVPNPQPSDIINNAVPLIMVHPSFASALNLPKNSTTKPSPSPKPKSKKKSKANTTKKPKSQKPKSRYSSNFNMQELYLDNQGSASANVASDAATTTPNVEIETAEEISPKSLNCEKGEIGVDSEKMKNTAPDTPSDDGVDEDQLNLKDAKDTLKSLANSVPSANAMPDAPTSLAQDQSQHDLSVEDDIVEKDTNVVADSSMQQEKDVTDDVDTDNAMLVDEDVTIVKTVADPKKRSGKTGVSSRLRERKGKETKIAAEATKSTKKKKVAADATKSAKKKMVGPVRRSSRVEIPAQQKKQSPKRKFISLSDSDYDAEEDAPSITTSPKKRTPKKRKTVVAASSADVEEDAPSIVSAKRRVGGRSIPPNVPDVPMDNVSFHFIDSAAKWKFVYHRRLALERTI